jgi:hypothetical protein
MSNSGVNEKRFFCLLRQRLHIHSSFLYYQFLFCLIHFYYSLLLHLLTDRVMITQSVCAICDTREEKRLLSGNEREKKWDIVFELGKANQLHTTPSFYRDTRVIFYFTTNSMIFFCWLNFVAFSCKIQQWHFSVRDECKLEGRKKKRSHRDE